MYFILHQSLRAVPHRARRQQHAQPFSRPGMSMKRSLPAEPTGGSLLPIATAWQGLGWVRRAFNHLDR
jgi:hypothetical protein